MYIKQLKDVNHTTNFTIKSNIVNYQVCVDNNQCYHIWSYYEKNDNDNEGRFVNCW